LKDKKTKTEKIDSVTLPEVGSDTVVGPDTRQRHLTKDMSDELRKSLIESLERSKSK